MEWRQRSLDERTSNGVDVGRGTIVRIASRQIGGDRLDIFDMGERTGIGVDVGRGRIVSIASRPVGRSRLADLVRELVER